MQVEKYDFDPMPFVAMSQELVNKGASYSDIIAYLHEQNVSPVSSVEVISDLYKTDMGTAKKIVFSHPIYCSAAEDSNKLHDALIEELKASGNVTEKNGFVTITIKL